MIAEEDGKSSRVVYCIFSRFRDVIGLFIEGLTLSKGNRKRGIDEKSLEMPFEFIVSGYVERKCLRYNLSA